MPLQTDKLTPLEAAQNGASSFAMNLLLNTALNETLKMVEEMRLQGRELLKGFKASEGDKKEEFKTAISLNIKDRKFLLETIFINAVEKDV
tara:strand:- start:285 stop:557 length:273 start_codon:yes stop_codon:yes gene_type:complete